MPTYALLGATGSTGSAILRCLLGNPPIDLKVNVFVRSKSKLLKMFPDLESTTAFKVSITEGTPSDHVAMQECLKDADVVFACIASNNSTRGITLAYDTATAIINALEYHRDSLNSDTRIPTVIQLRSATLNAILSAKEQWIARNMALFCFNYIYTDLDKACRLFESAAAKSPKLLDYIFVDPPSIHDAAGTTSTGYRLILDEKQEPVLSYADLGVAFCEVATRRDEFAGKGVGVTATGKVNQIWGTLMGYMATGIKGRIWG